MATITTEFLDDFTARHRGEMLTYLLPDRRLIQIPRDAVNGEPVIDYQLIDGTRVRAVRL